MRIACVHQGYELYGSDRCFAESVRAIRSSYPTAFIEVVLPREGPITTVLEGVASAVAIEPIWVLRRRNLWFTATIGMARLPIALLRAARRFRANDLVYINTSVIADYIVVSRMFPRRALLHVHEIPEGTTLKVLRALVSWSGAEIVFNSHATERAFRLPNAMRTRVIYNGISGPPSGEPVTFDGRRRLRVLMLGRINRIKGQEVLLEAVAALPDGLKARMEVRIVGSAFENPAAEDALHALSRTLGLTDIVTIEPFTADTSPLYRWTDWVVVPSRRPESLGRVAIEAMSYGRPVLASDIGGLAEVVADGTTGWLLPPGRSDMLSAALRRILEDRSVWHGFAEAARGRYLAMFSEAAAATAIAAAVGAM